MSNATNRLPAHWNFLVLFIATVMLAGCRLVVFDEPIGERQTRIQTLRFVGEWRLVSPDEKTNDEPLCMFVRIRKDGRLRVAHIKWLESEEKFETEISSAVATKVGEEEFLTWFEDPHEEESAKLIHSVRIKWIDQSQFEYYMADFDAFERLHKRNSIPGKLESHDKSRTLHIEADDLERYLQTNPDAVRDLFPSANTSSKDKKHPRIRRLR
ncbi:hypothetical protein [Thalassoroseus pseudoceratinae]|uniref:hypothetical protein n=1 Tax=Thalassoroseus pseudoceratinae TaxID=2713176 RepID=UPI0014206797|nr:hypothetical protein [Thalassoroseus pseudoceratinae]